MLSSTYCSVASIRLVLHWTFWLYLLPSLINHYHNDLHICSDKNSMSRPLQRSMVQRAMLMALVSREHGTTDSCISLIVAPQCGILMDVLGWLTAIDCSLSVCFWNHKCLHCMVVDTYVYVQPVIPTHPLVRRTDEPQLGQTSRLWLFHHCLGRLGRWSQFYRAEWPSPRLFKCSSLGQGIYSQTIVHIIHTIIHSSKYIQNNNI